MLNLKARVEVIRRGGCRDEAAPPPSLGIQDNGAQSSSLTAIAKDLSGSAVP